MTALSPARFSEQAAAALRDEPLQRALGNMRVGFIEKRRKAADKLPEFEALRDQGVAIKNHTLAHLDLYLEAYERKVVEAGGHVHWARDAEEARQCVLKICRDAGARTVTKGKSMIGEEMHLNPFLEANDIEPVETDLGEYIIQLRHETPSHIIAPAIHVNKEQVADAFREHHTGLPPDRRLDEGPDLLAEARTELRERFIEADVGITGANFLIAETGSSIIVTNEGNGDLTQTLPRVHIVLASLEKIVPTLEDATTLMRLLARSATGQEMSVYTTVSTGPRRSGDMDGPEAYHVILLDNGRSSLYGTEFQDVFRCIRCGACLNHCPVYGAIGGHAYGTVYPGPIGKVLSPALMGIDKAGKLPNASSFCGRCEEVCPMRIPLPKLMRHWREEEYDRKLNPAPVRWGLGLWAWAVRRPALYRFGARFAIAGMAFLGRKRGHLRSLPMAGGWTAHRNLPAPQGGTFHDLWRKRKGRPAKDRPMSGRDAILGALRQNLNRGADGGAGAQAVAGRLSAHRRNLIPARGQLDRAGRVDLFEEYATGADATVTRVASAEAVPAAVAGFLAQHNLPATLVRAPDAQLDTVPWQSQPTLTLEARKAEEPDAVSVTAAFGAVAETGTLVLVSGDDNPTTLNFLPENHIVVLWTDRISGDYESQWLRLRERYGEGALPRTVNLVTGPSRSADIEQTIQLGAHGPRRLHIVIVDE